MSKVKIKDIKQMTGYELRECIETLQKESVNKPYEVYKAEMMVFIEEINRRGRLIAKKHKKQYRPLTFAELR